MSAERAAVELIARFCAALACRPWPLVNDIDDDDREVARELMAKLEQAGWGDVTLLCNALEDLEREHAALREALDEINHAMWTVTSGPETHEIIYAVLKRLGLGDPRTGSL